MKSSFKLDLMDANDKFRFLHNNIIEPLRQACEKEIVEIEQQVLDYFTAYWL